MAPSFFHLKNANKTSNKTKIPPKKQKYRKTPHIVPRTDRTFFLFLGVYSGILCATVQQNNFQTIQTGTQAPEVVFMNFFSFFSGYIVQGLVAKISSKNRFSATFVNFYFAFLVVSVIEFLITGEKKLDPKNFFLEKLKMFGKRAPLISHQKNRI